MEGEPKEKIEQIKKKIEEISKKADQYVIDNEFYNILNRNGFNYVNAATGDDFTYYFCLLPANKLELWCALESDRFSNPVIRQFFKEIDVIAEERRMRVEDSPYGSFYEIFLRLAFINHPYRLGGMGYFDDIYNITITDVKNFYKKYYVPSNCVVAIVGNFDYDKSVKLIKKYFNKIPSAPKPLPIIPKEPKQKAERRVYLTKGYENNLIIAYHIPNYPNPDIYPLALLSSVLTDGRTSRLNRLIVQEKQLASSISSSVNILKKYPYLFMIRASGIKDGKVNEVERLILSEIEKLKTKLISKKELEKVRNLYFYDLLSSIESYHYFGFNLATFQLILKDLNKIPEVLDNFFKVTPKKIQEVAKKYLVSSNRTVGILYSITNKEAKSNKGE